MTPITDSTLLQALNWRYATKQFDKSRKIPAEIWATLEQALILSPSSFGLQPWKFIVIQNPGLRTELREASWGQPQVTDCSHLVVFLGQKNLGITDVDRYFDRTIEVRGGSKESVAAYRDMMIGSIEGARKAGYLDGWQSRQVYIALGVFLTTAAALGIDTCPIEGLNPAEYAKILNVDTNRWSVLCACAAGHRSADDKYAHAQKVRYPAAELIEHR